MLLLDEERHGVEPGRTLDLDQGLEDAVLVREHEALALVHLAAEGGHAVRRVGVELLRVVRVQAVDRAAVETADQDIALVVDLVDHGDGFAQLGETELREVAALVSEEEHLLRLDGRTARLDGLELVLARLEALVGREVVQAAVGLDLDQAVETISLVLEEADGESDDVGGTHTARLRRGHDADEELGPVPSGQEKSHDEGLDEAEQGRRLRVHFVLLVAGQVPDHDLAGLLHDALLYSLCLLTPGNPAGSY